MKNIIILAAVLLSMFAPAGYAQSKAADNYKYEKALEVLQEEGDQYKALDLLNRQIRETPKDVNALLLRAKIFFNNEEYGRALTDLNNAIKFNNKKSGVKYSDLLCMKAFIYYTIDEYDKAEDSYQAAVRMARNDDKDDLRVILSGYSSLLAEMKRYNESDAIYKQMLDLNGDDQDALLGLADNLYSREQYEAAVRMLEKCCNINPAYPGIYTLMYLSYDKLGETQKAIDAALECYGKDEDIFYQTVKILIKNKEYSIAGIKNKIINDECSAKWRMLLIELYEMVGDYELAVKEYYALEEEFRKNCSLHLRLAECYSNLGLADKALDEAGNALGHDIDYLAYSTIGDIYRMKGLYGEAIENYAKAIECDPTQVFGYYARGWSYELSGNDGKAMDDYNLGIDIDPTYPYIFLMRGELLLKQGNESEARKDFETVLQLDTLVDGGSCRIYALHLLGRNEEAEEWMQKIIDENPFDCSNYYDKACLYSRLGKPDLAMEALRKCLEMGYCSLAHIEHDDDLDALRDRDDFKTLMAEYRVIIDRRVATLTAKIENPDEMTISEVSFSRLTGGLLEIPCTVDGCSLKMTYDSSAGEVTISGAQAGQILSDVDIAEGTVITLKEMKIGEATLNDMEATVVKDQKEPLIIGQSTLNKFGTITIDKIHNKLLIRH